MRLIPTLQNQHAYSPTILEVVGTVQLANCIKI